MNAANFARWIVKNPGWRLLSLVLAFVIWMNVATEPEMSTFVSAPLQFKDPPETLQVAGRPGENVQLETRGSSGQLRDLANSHPVITFDFSSVHEPGDRIFPITRNEVNLPRGVELIRAIPSEVHFHFERRAASH